MINKQLKAIFIHIPKNAGTSIEKALGANLKNLHKGPNRSKHGTPKDKIYKNLWNNDEFFKFCFVRNTFDRFVSAYEYDYMMSFSKGYAMRPKGPDTARRKKVRRLGKEGFNTFVEDFFSKKRQQIPVWYRRQTYWTHAAEYDFIGRFENIEDDFKKVTEKLGIQAKLPKVNSSKRSNYKEYYNDKSIEIISNFYKKEIEEYNYSF